MAVPDPEDQDAAEPGAGGAPHREPDTDAVFAAIVAQWRTEPDAPRWPDDPDQDGGPAVGPDARPAAGPDAGAGGGAGVGRRGDAAVLEPPEEPWSGSAPADGGAAPPGDDDHFVPPDPPPFPVPRSRTVGGVAALALGVLLLAAPGLLGLGERVGTPLGLLVLTGAIGWLVLGLRSGPPPDSGWDDGAQL